MLVKNWYKSWGKRLLDVVASAVLLILLLPILLTSALLLLFIHRGRVFFLQERTGLHARRFVVYKFATMRPPAAGPATVPVPDHERITGLGRILRRYAIDELPQLLNVLLGHMSLVGPRPLLPQYLPHYTQRQALRHTVRPGLTGLAQINGRNATTWETRLEWDARYTEHVTLAQDLRIMLRTPLVLIHTSGNTELMPFLDKKNR